MKKIKLYRIAVLFAAVALLSCSIGGCKKYLDEKSNASLVVPSTLNDLQALLDNASLMNYQTPSYGEASSDDYFLEEDYYNSQSVLDQEKYTWSLTDYRFQNDWSFAYSSIYPTNICLERIDNIAASAAEQPLKNSIKGAALFYRAYYFQQLAIVFAKAWDPATSDTDPGIVLRVTSDINAPSVRASVKDTYQKIIADTKEAAELLPVTVVHPLRPSKAAAYGLLARTYLCMRMYDSAGKYANEALELNSSLLNYNDPAQVDLNSDQPFVPYNKEIVFYSHMCGWSGYFNGVNDGVAVDTLLYNSYPPDDLRKQAFYRPVGIHYAFKGNYAEAPYYTFSGLSTSEILLTRAEAYARKGSTENALADLNTLLINRYLAASFIPIITSTSAEALAIILSERRKELITRGIRWSDIKRFNKETPVWNLKRIISGQTFTLPANDQRFALPLPVDIIELSGISQN